MHVTDRLLLLLPLVVELRLPKLEGFDMAVVVCGLMILVAMDEGDTMASEEDIVICEC